jgi:hypothetical protein
VLFGSLSLVGFYNYLAHERRQDVLESALLPLARSVILLAFISSVSISVSDDGITITRWYVSKHFLPFSEVDYSDVQILAERDWPIQIKIHSKHRVLAQLGLKGIQREDAAWLCSLPQLQCIIHPGLTRRA